MEITILENEIRLDKAKILSTGYPAGCIPKFKSALHSRRRAPKGWRGCPAGPCG